MNYTRQNPARTPSLSVLLPLLGLLWFAGTLHADDSGKAEQHFKQGQTAYSNGDLQTAEIQLLLANREQPQRADVMKALANVYLIKRDYPKGLDWAQRLIEQQPNEASNYILKGQLEHGQGQHAQAQLSYETAARMAPNDPDIQSQVAGFFSTLGQHDQAESYSQRSKILRNPNNENR